MPHAPRATAQDGEGSPFLWPPRLQHASTPQAQSEGLIPCTAVGRLPSPFSPSSSSSSSSTPRPSDDFLRHSDYANTPSSTTLVSPSPSASGSSTPNYTSSAEKQPEPYYSPASSDGSTPPHMQSEPLVRRAANAWRSDPKYADWSDDEGDYAYPSSTAEEPPRWLSTLGRARVPRRMQRHLWLCLVLLLAAWVAWKWWLRPAWEEQRALEGMFEVQERLGFVFGNNVRPEFRDMVMVGKMDARHLPGREHGGEGRRLVVVGDVHGCKDELVRLLDKISFRPATDHLILTGDLVVKGPDSPGVVDLARSLSASCVRGNHDDRMLLAWRNMRARHAAPPAGAPASASRHADDKHRALARQFSEQQIRWLQACPVVLRVGPVPAMGEVVIVHAGLVPGVPLERQDPFMAMNMRSIDLYTRVPTEDRSGVPWERVWNRWQKRVPEGERVTVVYGHDSKRGLNVKKYSKGLDSGCVNGDRLTALVVEGGGRQGYVSVQRRKKGKKGKKE